ncbi:MAG: gamma-glutamyltransferase, partial [Betaproteobacteria bacterium]|nr:gamma-glutamyltransferase [Betaproteobacteria bacterium]
MFTWDFPYASQRMPLLAKNVVATSQPLAAQAGLQALARGGNAVDAALAAAITLTVVEPTSNGIGSDAFAILWDGEKLVGLNASGRAPAGWTPERFKGRTAMPVHGWDAVTVPGCVSAWVALSQRFGKLPFPDLFQAAIRYARDGFMVSPITAANWARQAPSFTSFSEFAWTFLPKDRAPRAG